MTSDTSCELLQTFLSALNHEIRTPLSVISNELFLLQADGQVVTEALGKVKEIDRLLNSYQRLVEFGEPICEVVIADLLHEAIGELPLKFENPPNLILWQVRPLLFTRALSVLLSMAVERELLDDAPLVIGSEGVRIPYRSDLLNPSEGSGVISRWIVHMQNDSRAISPLIDAILYFHDIVISRSSISGLLLSQQQ